MSNPTPRPLRIALPVGLGLLLLAGLGGRSFPEVAGAGDTQGAPQPAALPSLELEEDTPLLLDDDPADAPATAMLSPSHGVALNDACYVCHVNFKADPFVQAHASVNIGCANCHGASRDHVDDEANLTPPEIMYWPSRIDPSCTECHRRHTAPVQAVLLRWQERCPEKTNPAHILCTDCHGNHRLALRTIVWDQQTGLLVSKGRPMNVRAATGPSPSSPDVPDGGSTPRVATGAAGDLPSLEPKTCPHSDTPQ